jgi:hypothetical protein
MGERKSLNIEERRPSNTQESSLKITAMRDQKTGRISDVVSRNMDLSEILPYRIDEEGQLKIYLHDGVAKSIANAVPRSGISLDERQWSGHMVEALAVESHAMADINPPDLKNSALFARDHLGLKPQEGAVLERGPEYYPSPDYIDERIYTFYLKVEEARGAITPRNVLGHDDKFQARGIVREFDAQQILNAVSVGMIPNSRLELQILSLFQHLNIKPENWTDKQMKLEAGEISGSKSMRKFLQQYGMDEKRFREIKGSSGQLRSIHSTFVEEGQARGAITGLSAQDIDFVIHDGKTINTAVVLPLGSMKGEVHAAFLLDQMPVPERREGNGLTASAITFNLPPDVIDMKTAKKYVADKFSVMPEMVLKMGECYFSHIGVTPQKIYPFAVALPAKFLKDPGRVSMPLYQIMLMWQALSRDHKFSKESGKRPKMVWDTNFMVMISRCYRLLHNEFKHDAKLQVQAIVKERLAYRGPHWSIPLSYHQGPSLKDREPIKATPEIPNEKPSMLEHENVVELPVSPEQATTAIARQSASLPSLISDFESELQEFLEDFEEDAKPAPEKW